MSPSVTRQAAAADVDVAAAAAGAASKKPRREAENFGSLMANSCTNGFNLEILQTRSLYGLVGVRSIAWRGRCLASAVMNSLFAGPSTAKTSFDTIPSGPFPTV